MSIRTFGAPLAVAAAALTAAAYAATGSASPNANALVAGGPVNGGTLQAAMVSNPDHLDPALAYTTETWEILSATNDGLVTFRRVAGAASSQIVPDLATAMPTISDHGLTYTFHVRTGVMFSPPVSRAVEPTDIKFSIERLFRTNSPGVGYYSGIAGAAAYGKTKKGGISGIVANNARHTISFHLSAPDGTFLEYLAMPFASVVPTGTPDKDISTDAAWRIATGPYMIKQYTPQQSITIVRNPNFHSWTPNIPNGHLNEIDVQLGVSPDEAVNQIADDRRLLLRGRRPGPPRGGQAALPEPGADVHQSRAPVLHAQHAQAPDEQPPGPPGAQLRGKP